MAAGFQSRTIFCRGAIRNLLGVISFSNQHLGVNNKGMRRKTLLSWVFLLNKSRKVMIRGWSTFSRVHKRVANIFGNYHQDLLQLTMSDITEVAV